jgi:precorrin-2 dehydrogenase/sirohydrochlorin ferrochelatase
MQGELRAALPDPRRRRAFLRAALAGPAAEAAMAGSPDRARTLLVQGMAGFASSPGALQLLDGAGPADLLTLRAARALGEADLLIIDAAADPAIAVLARRDAPRLAEIAPQALAARLAEGLQIVWITAPGAAAKLASDTIGAEILPRLSPTGG